MIRVPISLKENFSLPRVNAPAGISIPFSNGAIFDTKLLVLQDESNKKLTSQLTIMAYWPNKSIKWLRVNFQCNITEKNNQILYLTDNSSKDTKSEQSPTQVKTDSSIVINETSGKFTINTGTSAFQLNKTNWGVFAPNAENKLTSQKNSFVLTSKDNIEYYPQVEQITHDQSPCSNQLQTTFNISGLFQNRRQGIEQNQTSRSAIKFSAEITFYAGTAFTQWRFILHNPNSMVHCGGKWDLGNENSLFFNSFNALLPLSTTNNETIFKTNLKSEQKNIVTDDFLIFQASSGGKNWQSKNHVNHLNKVPLEFKGYFLKTNKKASNIYAKDRASPSTCINPQQGSFSRKEHHHTISVHIKDFWQKFPKSIEVKANILILGLFPIQASDGFELQPGEKKSDIFYIDYNADQNNLDHLVRHFEQPINITICTKYLASTNTIPFFCDDEKNIETNYNKIINDGLDSKNNFFHKRELIDEYGWRNFGDLYADHETLEIEGNEELISHYNNQYDPLYGLLKQYLLTNDQQWLTLANDLADHVKNIDIYHTELDKVEYNGGLFWHTDHYLPAETASHRTYSKHQTSDAYQDHAGGGGPGGQHCYTTGLMLHYFLTGDKTSKECVLQLTNWITHVYEGSGTLTDLLLAIKNKHRTDIKNVFTGKYPLDRGTGHYIIALIDTFELTEKQSFLDQASLIIKNTVHPNDDINLRDLKNIEDCWFYTIFFQAVYRYLQAKEDIDQLDASFYYAKNSLLQYAKWMLKHEQPYLNTPEILEYPNKTWAAQDIRKANVLYMASYYSETESLKLSLKSKADEIYSYVTSTFSHEPTRNYTRILSILMQNQGIKGFVNESTKIENAMCHFEKTAKENYSTAPENNKLFNAFIFTLRNTSVMKELTWLRKRSRGMNRLLMKLGK